MHFGYDVFEKFDGSEPTISNFNRKKEDKISHFMFEILKMWYKLLTVHLNVHLSASFPKLTIFKAIS